MKKLLKSIFTFETILSSYITAIGYGVGYLIPNKYNLNIIICIICSLILGLVFDFLSKKILDTKYFNASINNKVTIAAIVYSGYLIAWLLVNYVFDYDLDYYFFSSVGDIILIQLLVIVFKTFKKYINSKKKSKE